MGKYMKKSKITSDVTVVMESTSLGVRTRAKTLADSSYLQLRNRRLEKPLPPPPLLNGESGNNKKPVQETQQGSCFNKKLNTRASSKMGTRSCIKEEEGESEGEGSLGNEEKLLGFQCEAEDFSVEVSFGENNLDCESRERTTRESTPCNLIKDSDGLETPGSTTRQAGSTATNRRVANNMQRNIPTTREMEEFFACAEQRQQRLFVDKYNFDIMNDLPLPGRYEWVQVIP